MFRNDKLPKTLPRHIAIVMDGNGRWARSRGLPRKAGHAAGSENFRRIATYCKDIGIEYLTVYAFSTENWKRPKDEVDAIFDLLRKYLAESIEKMESNRVKMKFIGDLSSIPEDIARLASETERISARYEGCQVNICINYGGRDEILRAARKLAANPQETLDEAYFSSLLDTSGIPDPDIFIRPSGEYRTSNFLIWQLAYSELFFTKTLWPDFSPRELRRILNEYAGRNRRFGGI